MKDMKSSSVSAESHVFLLRSVRISIRQTLSQLPHVRAWHSGDQTYSHLKLAHYQGTRWNIKSASICYPKNILMRLALNVPKLPWQAILRFRKHHLVSTPATMHLATPSGRFSMKDMESVLCLMFLRCKKNPEYLLNITKSMTQAPLDYGCRPYCCMLRSSGDSC
jgi:hypothetical protein